MNDDAISLRMMTVAVQLEPHSKIHLLSTVISVAAILALMVLVVLPGFFSPLWVLTTTSIMLLGVAELWVDVHVGFNRNLLLSIAADPDKQQQWGRALLGLKLVPRNKMERDLDERLSGCVSLMKWQAFLVVAQLAISITGVLSVQLHRF